MIADESAVRDTDIAHRHYLLMILPVKTFHWKKAVTVIKYGLEGR